MLYLLHIRNKKIKKIVLPDQSLNYSKHIIEKVFIEECCFFYTLILTKKTNKTQERSDIMDKKRYSKTRYQNIYKNIKNKNYIVSISTPKTTLSTIDGKKIYNINDAIKLRDDTRKKHYIIKQQN